MAYIVDLWGLPMAELSHNQVGWLSQPLPSASWGYDWDGEPIKPPTYAEHLRGMHGRWQRTFRPDSLLWYFNRSWGNAVDHNGVHPRAHDDIVFPIGAQLWRSVPPHVPENPAPPTGDPQAALGERALEVLAHAEGMI